MLKRVGVELLMMFGFFGVAWLFRYIDAVAVPFLLLSMFSFMAIIMEICHEE